MEVIKSILIGLLLGMIQGLTEWLPISSSGHLVAIQVGIGYEPPLLFDGLLHVASAAVVWVTFQKDIRTYMFAFLQGFVKFRKVGASRAWESQEARMGWFGIVAIIPTFLIGFFLYSPLRSLFSSLTAVGIAALVTTCVLAVSYFFRNGEVKKMSFPKAILIGLAQGAAIVPGISRSGSTICMGMFTGLDRETAARFSFLLAVPSLVGATAFVFLKNWGDFDIDIVATVVGVITVVVVGFISIRFLFWVVKRWGLHMFAGYTLVFGIVCTAAGLYYGL